MSLRTNFAAGVCLGFAGLSCQSSAPMAREPVPLAPHDARSSTATSAGTHDDAQYFTAPPDQREAPPLTSEAPSWMFPPIVDETLPNGLRLKLVQRTTLPLVQIQLVVLSGQDSDDGKPGLAVLAGEMLKTGGSGPFASRQLLERVESLGSSLNITTQRDATFISMQVTSDHFVEAMELLGLVVQKPQFAAPEYRKLKRREMDRVSSQAKSDSDWVSSMVLYRQLYGAQPGHPYAAYDATQKQIEQVQLWEAKRWYASHVTPKNSVLVVAGDISPEALKAASSKVLGAWRGPAPAQRKATAVSAPQKLELFLVDRPKSPQADVRWVSFGPTRAAEDWVPVKVADQILGGGVAGRLFIDVREKRSLAYSTYSQVVEVAQGPAPIILRAGTQTAKAGLALQALLEHAKNIGAAPPEVEETTTAQRYLSDVFLLRLETVGAMAGMTSNLAVLGLPNAYYDEYRKAIGAVTPERIHAAARNYYDPARGIVIVTGDAERLTPVVSHYGEVTVIDPTEEFRTVRTVPHNPEARLELERIDGT